MVMGEAVSSSAIEGPRALLSKEAERVASAIAREWLGSPELQARTDPEDLAQTTYAIAIEHLERSLAETGRPPAWWRPNGPLVRYLRGVARHMILHALRDPWAARSRSLAALENLHPELGFETPLERNEEVRRARVCLSELEEEERELLLQFGLGETYDTLAERLGATPAALAKRRARALARLKERCARCMLRIDDGCQWIPRGW